MGLHPPTTLPSLSSGFIRLFLRPSSVSTLVSLSYRSAILLSVRFNETGRSNRCIRSFSRAVGLEGQTSVLSCRQFTVESWLCRLYFCTHVYPLLWNVFVWKGERTLIFSSGTKELLWLFKPTVGGEKGSVVCCANITPLTLPWGLRKLFGNWGSRSDALSLICLSVEKFLIRFLENQELATFSQNNKW